MCTAPRDSGCRPDLSEVRGEIGPQVDQRDQAAVLRVAANGEHQRLVVECLRVASFGLSRGHGRGINVNAAR